MLVLVEAVYHRRIAVLDYRSGPVCHPATLLQ